METPPPTQAPITLPAPASKPILPLADIIATLSNEIRWRIFAELLKGEPLPVMELSRRLGVPATNISKHVALLYKIRILKRGYNNLYSIPAHFLVPGEPHTLDFGPALIRLDRLANS